MFHTTIVAVAVLTTFVPNVRCQASLSCNFNAANLCQWTVPNNLNAPEWTTAESLRVDAWHSVPRTITGSGRFAYAAGDVAKRYAVNKAYLISPELFAEDGAQTLTFKLWKTAIPPSLRICTADATNFNNRITSTSFDERDIRCHSLIVGGRAQNWQTERVDIPVLQNNYRILIIADNLNSQIDNLGIDDVELNAATFQSNDPNQIYVEDTGYQPKSHLSQDEIRRLILENASVEFPWRNKPSPSETQPDSTRPPGLITGAVRGLDTKGQEREDKDQSTFISRVVDLGLGAFDSEASIKAITNKPTDEIETDDTPELKEETEPEFVEVSASVEGNSPNIIESRIVTATAANDADDGKPQTKPKRPTILKSKKKQLNEIEVVIPIPASAPVQPVLDEEQSNEIEVILPKALVQASQSPSLPVPDLDLGYQFPISDGIKLGPIVPQYYVTTIVLPGGKASALKPNRPVRVEPALTRLPTVRPPSFARPLSRSRSRPALSLDLGQDPGQAKLVTSSRPLPKPLASRRGSFERPRFQQPAYVARQPYTIQRDKDPIAKFIWEKLLGIKFD